jgi:hypothetical protein
MDPATLTAFLAPMLAALLRPGEALAERAAGDVGDSLWAHAGRLWARLRPAVEAKPAAEEAVRDVAEQPDSEGARQSLAWQLEKLLAADPELARDLDQLWADVPRGGVVAGERGVAVGGDISHSTIVTGDSNVLRRGA